MRLLGRQMSATPGGGSWLAATPWACTHAAARACCSWSFACATRHSLVVLRLGDRSRRRERDNATHRDREHHEEQRDPHQPARREATDLRAEQARHDATASVRAKNASSRLVSTGRSSVGYWPSATSVRCHVFGPARWDLDAYVLTIDRRRQPDARERPRAAREIADLDPHRAGPRRVEHVVDRSRGHGATVREDRDLVAHQLDLAEQMARHEDRAAFGAERAHELADLADAGRVEPVRRLVEDQHLGILEERVAEPEALAHAERVAPRRFVGAVGEADSREHGVDALGPIPPPSRGSGASGGPTRRRPGRGSPRARRRGRSPPGAVRARPRRGAGTILPTGGRARARSGSSSSCPSRSGRGTRTLRRREPTARRRRGRGPVRPGGAGIPCAGARLR